MGARAAPLSLSNVRVLHKGPGYSGESILALLIELCTGTKLSSPKGRVLFPNLPKAAFQAKCSEVHFSNLHKDTE